MNLVDSKYIGLISSRLEKFKRVKAGLYNCRCPICGDSQKNKSKARGYIYTMKNGANYKCHNCGASMTLGNFIKQLDVTMHKAYVMDRFKDGKSGKGSYVEEPKFNFKAPTFKTSIVLPLCSEVEAGRTYLENRGVDPSKFYFAENFKGFVNSYKQTFGSDVRQESRIIIPLYRNKNLIGFQGRSLGPSKVKYITIMLDEDEPKIFGLDEIDKKLPVYVVEGPLDSTFVDNSVALCGSDGDVRCLDECDLVFVYDNEPRNREIVRRIEDCIRRNQSVVIWPDTIKDKDINDMFLSGHNVMSVIKSNTYVGLEALLKFRNWKKV
jgi:transcription elongation factor Elf1|tara:strand:- start:652 stop:1620 length:969 start_codon:yes stop_codon:yes gene_type:complete